MSRIEKSSTCRIGIDVGGTNTDAVLLEGSDLVHAVKTATTDDVLSGIRRALSDLLTSPAVNATGWLRS